MSTVASKKVQSASGTASKYRESYINKGLVEVDGEIAFEDLKGKIVEYIDREFKIKTERVYSIDKQFLRTEDGVGKRHRVAKSQIIFAYLRRNSPNPKVVI